MIRTAFGLVALAAFGWTVAARVLRETQPLLRMALAASLPLVALLTLVNMLARHFSFDASLDIAIVALGIVSAVIWAAERRAAPAESRRFEAADAIAAALALVAGAYCLLYHYSHTDDDYWIHTALIGLFQNSHFPPINPFLPELELQGHYGRDLTVAAVSRLLDADFLQTITYLATYLQMVTFLLLYSTGSWALAAGWRGLVFASSLFFGINYYVRAGILDTLANNNPVVHLYLALLLYCFVRAAREDGTAAAIVGGWILGVSAIVYETNYALTVASLLCFAALPLRRPPGENPLPRRALVMVLCSVPMVLLEGGPIFHFLARAIGRGAASGAALDLDVQSIVVRFPKKPFFTVGGTASALGPQRFFSRFVLGQFGPSLFLAPLTLVMLIAAARRRLPGVRLGVFCWILGAIALLVPTTIDFGAFNEEYNRLFYLSAFAFAAAMGVALCLAAEVFVLDAQRSRATRAAAAALLAAMLVVDFCGYTRIEGVRRGAVVYLVDLIGTRLRHPEDFVSDHRRLVLRNDRAQVAAMAPFLRPVDFAASGWLRRNGARGQRTLQNLSIYDYFGQATVVGYSGLPMVGFNHRGPMGGYASGFRAIAFWATLDSDLLDDLGPDWLYVDPTGVPPALQPRMVDHPRLTLVKRVGDGTGAVRLLYKVSRRPAWSAPAAPAPAASLRVEALDLPAELPPNHYARGLIRLSNVGEAPVSATGFLLPRLVFEPSQRPVNRGDEPRSRATLALAPRASADIAVHFVTPYVRSLATDYREGSYRIDWYWAPDAPAGRPVLLSGAIFTRVRYVAAGNCYVFKVGRILPRQTAPLPKPQ